MHGFFRWSHVFHDFLLVSLGFQGGYVGIMDFGWFPSFLRWFQRFCLVTLAFSVVFVFSWFHV